MRNSNTIISHLYRLHEDNDQWVVQTNDEHCKNVSRLAQQFASEFSLPTFGCVTGLLHDKGKEQLSFQQYIRRESGYDASQKVEGDTHHAYVGGVISRQIYGCDFDWLIANQIISHHTGLHDYTDVNVIATREMPNDVGSITNLPGQQQLIKELCKLSPNPTDAHHISRMLFSCLVDADYLDTESFMDKEASLLRAQHSNLHELNTSFESFLKKLKATSPETPINTIRQSIQQRCLEMAKSPIGFYSLTVPTGGGKTLSSLVWAIKHALHNGQKRIIIAIPYTSIIAQTAAILKSVFGEDNVLEHHSNFNIEDIKDDATRQKTKLATENWDYPIIVTTNVQLFESMLENRPSKCRKLHNICNSVIILDEVQTLPSDYLLPIVDSLKTYNRLFKTSILLTTASQPVLSGDIIGCNYTVKLNGIDKITEIIPNDFNLHKQLHRAEISIDNTINSYSDVAQCMQKHKQVLCIVNTRKDAKHIFDLLPDEGITLHLSKMMCPAHIKQTIAQLKDALKSAEKPIIRVVSTQLIEAGVDIDFPVVLRQEAGLDSVLQAAGRCNREGKLDKGNTIVFSLAGEHPLPPGSLSEANNARLNLGEIDDWFSPETMKRYFTLLYSSKNTFDKSDINHYLYNIRQPMFATYAREFKLIEDTGKTVIVNFGNSAELVERLRDYGPSYMLIKQLNQYAVTLHNYDFKKLAECGAIDEPSEGFYYIPDAAYYSCHTGLTTDNHWMEEILIK